MGGEAAGAFASATVCQQLRVALELIDETTPADHLRPKRRAVIRAAAEASRLIHEHAQSMGESRSGTTLAMLLLDEAQKRRGLILHAGDSRVYRVRNGVLEVLTNDHSLAAAIGGRGQHVPTGLRHQITRAIGLPGRDQLELTRIEVEAGDLYLLCSDGLTDMVDPRALHRFLRRETEASPAALADSLVAEANRCGGRDNISVVAVAIGDHPDFTRPSPAWEGATRTDPSVSDTAGGIGEGRDPGVQKARPPRPRSSAVPGPILPAPAWDVTPRHRTGTGATVTIFLLGFLFIAFMTLVGSGLL